MNTLLFTPTTLYGGSLVHSIQGITLSITNVCVSGVAVNPDLDTTRYSPSLYLRMTTVAQSESNLTDQLDWCFEEVSGE